MFIHSIILSLVYRQQFHMLATGCPQILCLSGIVSWASGVNLIYYPPPDTTRTSSVNLGSLLKYVGSKLKVVPNTLLEYALSDPEIPISCGVSEPKKIAKCIFLLLSIFSI